jgi:predicted nucleic acid-binding protein
MSLSTYTLPTGTVLYVAEPSPQFLRRPALVVDCSLLAALHFKEPESEVARQRLTQHALHAPSLLDHEMLQVGLTKLRRREPEAAVLEGLRDYFAQDIQLHDTDAMAQFELARRYGLSAYDAAYLWLAAELRAPLATFDRRLAEAAQQHLGSLT